MTTPSSGAISFSQIVAITMNNASATVTLNDGDVRTLLGVSSGQISMDAAWGKPVAGSAGYGPGSYTFYVPPYQYLTSDVAGGGSGGNGGSGCNNCTCACCCICYYGCYPFPCGCCTSCGGGNAGGYGGDSVFNGVAAYGGSPYGYAAYSSGGNNQNGNVGGGGGGGGAGGGFGCCAGGGSNGNSGGRVQFTWTKGYNGPGYGAGINFYVGGGAGGGYNGGGTGGNGWVNIYWS
jgi:hypothetical protein